MFFLSVLLLFFSSPFAVLLGWFYPNPRVLPFPPDSPPHLTGKDAGVREQLRGSVWPTEAEPQQIYSTFMQQS